MINNLPIKLISIFGSEKDLLIKGKNCGSQGFGIGAITYYRRIVENQKGKLLDFIIKTLEKLGGYDQIVVIIRGAKKEIRFTKSIELIKDV